MARGRRGAREGSIFQRKDGRWVGQIDIGYVETPQGRKRRYRTVTAMKREGVVEGLTKLLREQQTGTLPTAGKLTVGEFLTAWLAGKKTSLRPSTVASYTWLVTHHLVPQLGGIRLEKLQPADVERALHRLLAAGLSPRSVNHARAVLRASLNKAVKQQSVSRNVAALADAPKVEAKQVLALTPEESQHFIDTLAGDRLEALYRIALGTGLRQGELLGLRWEDVDLDGRQLRVTFALAKVDGKLKLVSPKTTKSCRPVPLRTADVDALRAHKKRQVEEQLLAGAKWRDSGLVFPSSIGTPLQPSTVTRAFQTALAKAKVRRVRFHDLRHSYASFLISQGVHPRVVMELLGHSSIQLTMNTYSHVFPALLDDAASAIDRALSPG